MPINITGLFQPSGGAGAFDLYQPEDIQAGNVDVSLTLIANGKILCSGISGEIKVQTFAGTPVHTANEGTPCWDTTNNKLYVNNNGTTGWTEIGTGGGVTDHGALTGLADDDHTQYALLAGRVTGQILVGGTAAGEDLLLQSTAHGTKGSVFFGATSGPNSMEWDEVNGMLSLPNGRMNFGNSAADAGSAGHFRRNSANLSFHDGTAARNVLFDTATQTLTNKKLTDASVTFADDGDLTKQLAFQCSGITTATTRTLTIQDVSGTVYVTGGSDVAVTDGGTALSSVAQGDLLYGSAANTYSLLNKNTSATRYLSNTGASNNPAWAQVDLTNGVTGILPVANGGTGLSTALALYQLSDVDDALSAPNTNDFLYWTGAAWSNYPLFTTANTWTQNNTINSGKKWVFGDTFQYIMGTSGSDLLEIVSNDTAGSVRVTSKSTTEFVINVTTQVSLSSTAMSLTGALPIYFGAPTEKIYSGGSNTLIVAANTTTQFNIGGATEMTLTANYLTFNNSSSTWFRWDSDYILKIGITGVWNNEGGIAAGAREWFHFTTTGDAGAILEPDYDDSRLIFYGWECGNGGTSGFGEAASIWGRCLYDPGVGATSGRLIFGVNQGYGSNPMMVLDENTLTFKTSGGGSDNTKFDWSTDGNLKLYTGTTHVAILGATWLRMESSYSLRFRDTLQTISSPSGGKLNLSSSASGGTIDLAANVDGGINLTVGGASLLSATKTGFNVEFNTTSACSVYFRNFNTGAVTFTFGKTADTVNLVSSSEWSFTSTSLTAGSNNNIILAGTGYLQAVEWTWTASMTLDANANAATTVIITNDNGTANQVVLKQKIGKAASNYAKFIGTASVSAATAGNTATNGTEEMIRKWTVPDDALVNDGDWIRFSLSLGYATATSTKRFRFRYGGTGGVTIFDSSNFTATGYGILTVTVVRDSATSIRAWAVLTGTGAGSGTGQTNSGLSTGHEAGTNDVGLTTAVSGTGASANDIVCYAFVAEYGTNG